MSSPIEYKRIVVNENPTKEVNLKWGQSDSTFKIETTKVDESSLEDGQVLVKNVYFSNDPTQRGWIQKGLDPTRMYAPPVKQGEPVRSLAIFQVISSKSEKYAKGDLVHGISNWGEYSVIPESSIFNKVDTSSGLPIPAFLGTLGLTGLTAFFGLSEIAQFKEGQTILVSAASGATGSMVVQLAKHLFKAKKVIGITGSKEKGKFVESLGADFTVDYHDDDWKKQLADYIGTDYVDAYYDNVGGDILSFALSKIKTYGVVVACGAISGYNDSEKYAVKTWPEIVTNRLRVQGFIVSDFAAKFPNAVAQISGELKKGNIKIAEGFTEVDVSKDSDPLSKVPEVWHKLFTSEKPNGKLVTKFAEKA